MKNWTILLFFIGASPHLLSQSKADYTWVLGYQTAIPGQPNTESEGGMFLKFTDKTVQVQKFDIFSGAPSAVANDEQGNLQFYTNGCGIYSHNMQPMENGDGINVGGQNYIDNCLAADKSYSIVRSGVLILSKPGADRQYVQFHLRLYGEREPGTSSVYHSVFDQFYHSDVDMSANGGLGTVTAKNQVVVADSLQDAVCAVRHGNGRDWWVIIPRGTGREFWKILLTPEGVQNPVLDSYPPYPPFDIHYADFETGAPITPDEYEFESWAGQAIFSPDGTKYCRLTKAEAVEIYDFDRCTGQMHLLRNLPFPSYYRSDPTIAIGAGGLAISPNNRYLYFNNNETLYQFDMCLERIEKGDFETIAEYNGQSDDGFPTSFFQMRSAPDGKIYMGCSNGTRSLHVINNPYQAGLACNFVQRGLRLPRWYDWVINYFPNFRLYDVAGSPCDTLGIDDPYLMPKPEYTFEDFRVFPNPAQNEAILYLPNCESARVVVWNVAGQFLREIPALTGKEAYRLSVADWPSGVYIIAAYIEKDKPTIRRLVVTH